MWCQQCWQPLFKFFNAVLGSRCLPVIRLTFNLNIAYHWLEDNKAGHRLLDFSLQPARKSIRFSTSASIARGESLPLWHLFFTASHRLEAAPPGAVRMACNQLQRPFGYRAQTEQKSADMAGMAIDNSNILSVLCPFCQKISPGGSENTDRAESAPG